MAGCKRCVLKSRKRKENKKENKRKMGGKWGSKECYFICAVVIFVQKTYVYLE